MNYKKSTKYNLKNRTERSEVHSRPKGVNESGRSRTLDRKLKKIHKKTGSNAKVLQELLKDQWKNNFRPEWFITLEWNDLPTRYETASGHSRHFKNVFLKTLKDHPLNQYPNIPDLPSMVFFHERRPVIIRGRQITAFHTHLHMGPLEDLLNVEWYLDHLIHEKVSPRVQRLLKTTSEGNRGVVIKPWVWDHHAFYNLKDYYSYRHHQDPDLVLDYQNSDLVF